MLERSIAQLRAQINQEPDSWLRSIFFRSAPISSDLCQRLEEKLQGTALDPSDLPETLRDREPIFLFSQREWSALLKLVSRVLAAPLLEVILSKLFLTIKFCLLPSIEDPYSGKVIDVKLCSIVDTVKFFTHRLSKNLVEK